MLSALLVSIQQPGSGLQRFHDFLEKTKCFSVQVAATSNRVPSEGRGSYLVLMPSSFRLNMAWGTRSYSCVKNAGEVLEFESDNRTYQHYPADRGLAVFDSLFADLQYDSLPLSLMRGGLEGLAPRGTVFSLISRKAGTETYAASWSGPQGSGKIVAAIDSVGRLVHFDIERQTQTGPVRRIMDFKNYVIDPPAGSDTFSMSPPIGYTSYRFPFPEITVSIGDALQLGKWSSAKGPVSIDPVVRGKLIIVRQPDSTQADGLIAYLAKQGLPVQTVVLSLANSGGDYWSPSPQTSRLLSSVGTPFLIFLQENKVKSLWLGFDPDRPTDVLTWISNAAKGKLPE